MPKLRPLQQDCDQRTRSPHCTRACEVGTRPRRRQIRPPHQVPVDREHGLAALADRPRDHAPPNVRRKHHPRRDRRDWAPHFSIGIAVVSQPSLVTATT